MDTGSQLSDSTAAEEATASPEATRLDEIRHGIEVRWRWVRKRATVGVQALSRSVDQYEVMKEVVSDGELCGRYVFMVVMSCAIAILGLLLSSPAVVIGAMLISPLMGPIMLMGFSLCALDYSAMRRALISIAAGVAAALAISILIVLFSPLREATPEILARTRPNLFDLLVAIFSGLAGGYSVIHRKGATIVGVAIATALMPPIAVVGFGIATWNMVIAGGAFFLFMTNLLAIALSVTGLAWLHGFASVHSEKAVRWQTALVIAVFVGLSLPLGFALRNIAYEARVQNVVRDEALRPFPDGQAEVSSLTVSFPHDQPIQILQTVMTHERVPTAEAQLTEHYSKVLKAPVKVRLLQVLVDQAKPIDTATVQRLALSSLAPLQRQINVIDERAQSEASVRDAVPFKALAVDVDAENRRVMIVPAPNASLSLASYHEMEQQLSAHFPEWSIAITPSVRDLPSVSFDQGGANISEEGLEVVDTIVWALKRWDVKAVEVEGHSSIGGSASANRRLALARAQAVADQLTAQGFEATPVSAYTVPKQATKERELGKASFQSATVSVKS